jgi:hypothetical protein
MTQTEPVTTTSALWALGIRDASPHDRAETIANRLHDLLASEYRALVDGLAEAERECAEQWYARTLEALAAHFPGFAPAIRAVVDHLQENDAGADEDCRLGRAVYHGVRWRGCAEPIYAGEGDPLERTIGPVSGQTGGAA